MVKDHSHVCIDCGTRWTCGRRERCHINTQAQSLARERSGPLCHLCYHWTLAKLFAEARGLRFVAHLTPMVTPRRADGTQATRIYDALIEP